VQHQFGIGDLDIHDSRIHDVGGVCVDQFGGSLGKCQTIDQFLAEWDVGVVKAFDLASGLVNEIDRTVGIGLVVTTFACPRIDLADNENVRE